MVLYPTTADSVQWYQKHKIFIIIILGIETGSNVWVQFTAKSLDHYVNQSNQMGLISTQQYIHASLTTAFSSCIATYNHFNIRISQSCGLVHIYDDPLYLFIIIMN